eukprot:TRINITY_DN16079_c0_g2_i1.p1 TRINITY_DN16079_c0_g2~~TRINITY_DN16079_c0_g2_i1.p1  ORF type:complete len:661 (-),score=217.31 TRINITY_DN16079_c0_g2_i1:79-2061(-)
MQTATMHLLLLAASASALLIFDESAAKQRPVTKVLDLLQGIKEQVDKEAEEEAEIMEKSKCWCKENAEKKSASLVSGEKQSKQMESGIQELAATGARLEVQIKNSGNDLTKQEESLARAQAMREKQVEKFQAEHKDVLASIGSVNSSLELFKSAGSSFLQSTKHQAITATLQSELSRHVSLLRPETAARTSAFLQDPQTAQVEGLLKGIHTDLVNQSNELENEEAKNKAAFEKIETAIKKEIEATKNQIATEREEKAAASEDMMRMKYSLKELKESMGADLAFAEEVTEKCGKQAKELEKRQKTRAEELKAISKAIEVLGADDAQAVFGKTLGKGPNTQFLQVSSSSHNKLIQERLARASATLADAGKNGDQRLVTLALQTKLNGDGLETVKYRIDELISALKSEQAEEAKKKDYCTEELNSNRLSSEAKKRNQKGLAAQVEQLKVKLQTATEEQKTLQDGIDELRKQQLVASQNREKENGEFQKVIQEQRQSAALLKQASKVLEEFYAPKVSLLQRKDAKEPDTSGDYKKNEAGNGVLLMLQQLIAEAGEMAKEAAAAEQESQADYEALSKDIAASSEAKRKAIADKAEAKAMAERKHFEAKESKEGVEKEVATLESTISELHENCDWTLTNFGISQKARMEEIDALMQAKSYLSGAKL